MNGHMTTVGKNDDGHTFFGRCEHVSCEWEVEGAGRFILQALAERHSLEGVVVKAPRLNGKPKPIPAKRVRHKPRNTKPKPIPYDENDLDLWGEPYIW